MPKRTLVRRPSAQRDLAEATRYFVEHAGNDVAHGFLDDVEHAFERLARFPNLGRAWPTRNAELRGLRRLPLRQFPLSIFYRSSESAIEVIRVLHHARDIPPLLDDI
jgi:toxin ParE1/3/4